MPRAFASALTIDQAHVTILGPGRLPPASFVSLNRSLSAEDNYRWVWVQGQVKFAGVDGSVAFLEVTDGSAQIQIRTLHWTPELARGARDRLVRVEGMCEGMYDRNGTLVPGVIWASAPDSISLVDSGQTSVNPVNVDPPVASVA